MNIRTAAYTLFFFLIIIHHVQAVDVSGVSIHGFISQGYMISDDNNYLGDSNSGSFDFNELGINFSRDLTDSLRIGIQFFSRDLGQYENNDILIDWAYGDYRWKDWLGIRAGIIRQAHGLYNETRDIDMLRTAILLPQSVYVENDRDFLSRIQGGSLYGEIPLSVAGSLGYTFLIGTKNIDEDGTISKWAEASGIYKVTGYNEGTFYNGSLLWHTPLTGLKIGATFLKTNDFEMNVKTTIPLGPSNPVGTDWKVDFVEFYEYVFSVEYIRNNLSVAAEHIMGKNHSKTGTFAERNYHPFGCYASVSYRLTDWFELGGYYSIYYYDKNDKDGDFFKSRGLVQYRAWQKDIALSLRFDINDYCVFKLEGHRMNGAALLLPQENREGMQEDWYLFAAKMTFSF